MQIFTGSPAVQFHHGFPEPAQGPADARDLRLRSNEIVMASGEPLRLFILPQQDTAFLPPGDPYSIENDQYRNVLATSEVAAQISQGLCARLFDTQDGLTRTGVVVLTENLHELDSALAAKIRPFLFLLERFSCNIHPTRSCVLLPPCPRSEFEGALTTLTDQSVDWKGWLDHLYNAVPTATQGFHLYETPEDQRRLRAAIPGFAEKAAAVQAIFDAAVSSGTFDDAERSRYDHLSQELIELELSKLNPALEQASEAARSMSTRCYISTTATGEPSFRPVHYSAAFREDLDLMADKLDLMKRCLPGTATETRAVVADLVEWCRTPSNDPKWGQSRPTWINSGSTDSVLDILFVAEEKGSHLGSKGAFHFAVSQHIAPPVGLENVWELLVAEGASKNVTTLLLRTLIVGGFNSQYVVSGEKLPDPAGEPRYKSMTFANTSGLVQVASQGHAIAAATGLPLERVEAMGNTMVAAVALHERGHTLGDHSEFLGSHANSVEETNAQGSAVYLASKFLSGSLSDVLALETCWMPVRRVRQGPTEPHSRSDIVLFEEYLSSGAIEIVENGDHSIVRVKDEQVAVDVAFTTANKMRLWEKGLPSRLHGEYLEKFDPTDDAQDARIVARAVRDFSAIEASQQGELRAEVIREVESFFSNDRLREIGAKLNAVVAGVKVEQTLAVFPSSKLLQMLVGT